MQERRERVEGARGRLRAGETLEHAHRRTHEERRGLDHVALARRQRRESFRDPLVELVLELAQRAPGARELETDRGAQVQHELGLASQERVEALARQHPQAERRHRDDARGARLVGQERELAEHRKRLDEVDRRARDPALRDAFAQDVERVTGAARFEHHGARVDPAVFEDARELGEIDGRERREERDGGERLRSRGGVFELAHADDCSSRLRCGTISASRRLENAHWPAVRISPTLRRAVE
jgi:hypothetical protein